MKPNLKELLIEEERKHCEKLMDFLHSMIMYVGKERAEYQEYLIERFDYYQDKYLEVVGR